MSRAEYMRYYRAKRKNENSEKSKQLQSLKDELERTISQNKDWFDPNRNPYLNRLSSEENQKYHKEKRKRFNLQYDIDHFYEREKGDYKKYTKQRDKDYSKLYQEEDIKFQIIKWRMFKKACLDNLKREPDFTDMMYNNICKPCEICEDSEFYRPDLLGFLENQPDDREFELSSFEVCSDEE